MEKKMIKVGELKKVLFESWSLESSSKWSKDNPAKGQCGVTALVVHDKENQAVRWMAFL
jgi:hypothetical protein